MHSPNQQSERRILLSAQAEMRQERGFTMRQRELDLVPGLTVKISEVTLLPKTEFDVIASESSLQCLLPMVGEIRLESGMRVELGELWSQFKPKNGRLSVSNPFSKESVHFLRIEIPSLSYFPETFSPFRFENIKDRISPIFTHRDGGEYFRISVGNLGGRKDVEFPSQASSVALVLSGAMEYQNCLLEQGDCLALNGACTLEMEALSEETLVLILEFAAKEEKFEDPLRN